MLSVTKVTFGYARSSIFEVHIAFVLIYDARLSLFVLVALRLRVLGVRDPDTIVRRIVD